jgi:hypothetical protein
MAQSYQYSIFTLTAIRELGQPGVLPSGSQLGERSLIRLPYRDRQGNKTGYVYLYLVDHNLRTSYGKFIRNNELIGRGWVFQEQMLSRRLLYYTGAGVIFECRTGNPQNTLGDKWTKSGVQGDDFGAAFRWIRRIREDDEDSNRLISVLLRGKFDLVQRSFDTWCKLVEEYSSKELTYWSDRIPALSGITAEYRRNCGEFHPISVGYGRETSISGYSGCNKARQTRSSKEHSERRLGGLKGFLPGLGLLFPLRSRGTTCIHIERS